MSKIFCPKCSIPANPVYRARTVGTAAGLVAGGVNAVGSILREARLGPLGVMAGTLLHLLFGVSSGGFIGSQAGKLIDENVIGLYKCPRCNLRFKA